MTTTASRVAKGALAPMSAIRFLLAQPSYWPLVVGPSVVIVFTMVLGMNVAYFATPFLMAALFPTLHAPLLTFVLQFLFTGIVMMPAFGLGVLLTIPITDRLSERVEDYRGVDFDRVSAKEALFRSITHSFFGFALWILAEVLLFFVGLIPAVGAPIALIGGWLSTLAFLSHQIIDGPLSRKQLGFVDKWRVLRQWWPECFGLSAVSFMLIAVPCLNFITWPVVVAAGVWMYADRLKELDELSPDEVPDALLLLHHTAVIARIEE